MKKHLAIGKIGEDLACKFLINKGFNILYRNVSYKFSEIDIICIMDINVHYIEVKTDSMSIIKSYENMTVNKTDKFHRISEFHFNKFYRDKGYRFHLGVVLVSLDLLKKESEIELILN